MVSRTKLPLDATTHVQLQLVAELAQLLSTARIPFWLRGGWAIDFVIGSVTRKHHDIDFLLWASDVPAATHLLVSAGYQRYPVKRPDARAVFVKDNQYISFALLRRSADGRICADWVLDDDALTALDGRVGEIECPVMGLASLLVSKETYHHHVGRSVPRSIDILDAWRLRRFLRAQGKLPTERPAIKGNES